MKAKIGLMLLDVLIIILAVGVIATLMLPYLRTESEIRKREDCRRQLLLLSEAELKYFETAGGKFDPKKAAADSLDSLAQKKPALKPTKGKKGTAVKDSLVIIRSFTRETGELKRFLSEGTDTASFSARCPLDGRDYIIVARDSFFFSISCPNGHGQIIMGAPTWEEGK